MILRCPICRADNTSGPACRRCRADLSLLISVEARRDFHFARARAAAHGGQFDAAMTELAQAEGLRAGPDVCRLRACVFLLARFFAPALAEYAAVAS